MFSFGWPCFLLYQKERQRQRELPQSTDQAWQRMQRLFGIAKQGPTIPLFRGSTQTLHKRGKDEDDNSALSIGVASEWNGRRCCLLALLFCGRAWQFSRKFVFCVVRGDRNVRPA
jgi:hypothetical protein